MAVHPRAPWKDVAFVGGYWNCAERLDALLGYVRPWFGQIVVGVQESPDNTLEVARKWADVVVEDKWHKRGDPTIHLAAQKARSSKYAFVVSDDEWPSEDLLNSFQDLVNALVAQRKDGAWITFESWIDGYDFTKGDNHLRFWKPQINWPPGPHARPATDNTIRWETGSIKHDRTLDEMMIDYLNRYDVSNVPGWEGAQAHNKRMMLKATEAIAARKGWEYVKAFEWWPRVRDLSWNGAEQFDLVQPEQAAEEPAPPKPRRPRGRPRKAPVG